MGMSNRFDNIQLPQRQSECIGELCDGMFDVVYLELLKPTSELFVIKSGGGAGNDCEQYEIVSELI